MNHSRSQLVIIIISCGFHALILFLLLALYKYDATVNPLFNPPSDFKVPETVFYDPISSAPTPVSSSPEPTKEDESWAELKPRAGTLGQSMEMPENPGIETADYSEQKISETSEAENSSLKDNSNFEEVKPLSSSPQDLSSFPIPTSAPIIITPNEISKTSFDDSISSSKQTSSRQQREARKALATITRSYLQHLEHEGNNLIKTIGGDPNKTPTDQQLKVERYLAKIQWCLQNAHAINQEKCQTYKPVQTTMKMYFKLNRTGSMSDLRIVQSSGDTFVDNYIFSLFQFASSSFPPLPAYMKEESYPLFYTVMVNWNVNQPFHMGLNRQ